MSGKRAADQAYDAAVEAAGAGLPSSVAGAEVTEDPRALYVVLPVGSPGEVSTCRIRYYGWKAEAVRDAEASAADGVLTWAVYRIVGYWRYVEPVAPPPEWEDVP